MSPWVGVATLVLCPSEGRSGWLVATVPSAEADKVDVSSGCRSERDALGFMLRCGECLLVFIFGGQSQ